MLLHPSARTNSKIIPVVKIQRNLKSITENIRKSHFFPAEAKRNVRLNTSSVQPPRYTNFKIFHKQTNQSPTSLKLKQRGVSN